MLLRNVARHRSLGVARSQEVSRRGHAVAAAAVVTSVLLAGCGGNAGSAGASADGPSTPSAPADLDRVVNIEATADCT